MTAPKLSRLGNALDRRNWLHLEDTMPDIAAEIDRAVTEGATPEEIAAFMRATIGEHRTPLIVNCLSAARWLAGK